MPRKAVQSRQAPARKKRLAIDDQNEDKENVKPATKSKPVRKSTRIADFPRLQWAARQITYEEQHLLHRACRHWRYKIGQQVLLKVYKDLFRDEPARQKFLEHHLPRDIAVQLSEFPKYADCLRSAPFYDTLDILPDGIAEDAKQKWLGSSAEDRRLSEIVLNQWVTLGPRSLRVLMQPEAYPHFLLKWTGRVTREEQLKFSIDEARELCRIELHWEWLPNATPAQLARRALEILDIYEQEVAPQTSIIHDTAGLRSY